MTGARLQDLSEEELLARLFPLFGASTGAAEVLLGPGDDAAVLATPSGTAVLTTDSMIRGRDWRDDWSAPEEVGRKVVVQNLADIAAMGALPTGLLVALAADPSTEVEWAIGLARGIAAAAQEAGAPVLGGDLSSAGPGTVLVGVTAVGDLGGHAAVRRDGARAGDVVACRGSLGRSGGGLQLLLDGRGRTHFDPPLAEDADDLDAAVDELCRVHRRTAHVPWRSGAEAAAAGATAMIDLSDGLVRDLGRVAASSGVRVELDGEALTAAAAGALTTALGPDGARRQVLSGGEEHSLLATFPVGAVPEGWRAIGACTEGSGVGVDGESPTVIGWDHFGG